jgi:hypothetical protein
MGQKRFWQYQTMVWSRAVRKTWDTLGIPGAIIGFAASFVADLFIRLEQSRTDVNVGDVVITAGIFLGLCIAALILNVFREPFLIYNEQVDEISERDSDIAKLKYTIEGGAPLQIDTFEEDPKVGVCITNPNSQRITDLEIKLIGDASWVDLNHLRQLCDISLTNRQFVVPDYSKEIPANDRVYVYLAFPNSPSAGSAVYFLLRDTYTFDTFAMINNTSGEPFHIATIEFVLKVSGMLNNHNV